MEHPLMLSLLFEMPYGDIDGQHQTLSDRSCLVPHIFTGFTEYNNPKKLKHKKRSTSSLCADTLKSNLQRFFWQSAASLLVGMCLKLKRKWSC